MARSLRESLRATLHAPFPSTTSVALATVATALPPSRHGLISPSLLARRVRQSRQHPEMGRPLRPSGPSRLWLFPARAKPLGALAQSRSRANHRAAGGVRRQPSVPTRLPRRPLRADLGRPRPRGGNRSTGLRAEPADLHLFLAGRLRRTRSRARITGFTVPFVWPPISGRRWRRGAAPDVTVVGTADHGLLDYADEDKLLVRDPRFQSPAVCAAIREEFTSGEKTL